MEVIIGRPRLIKSREEELRLNSRGLRLNQVWEKRLRPNKAFKSLVRLREDKRDSKQLDRVDKVRPTDDELRPNEATTYHRSLKFWLVKTLSRKSCEDGYILSRQNFLSREEVSRKS